AAECSRIGNARLCWRIRLGGSGKDVLLGRPAGTVHRSFHDAVHGRVRSSGQGLPGARLSGDHRLRRGTAVKSYREELTFETKTRRAYINITPQVEAALKKSGVKEGLCLVNPMHISASVYINDDEPGLLKDYDEFLERLAPHEPIDQY